MWNKKEVHRLHVGYDMWPWHLTLLMTLTLDVSRSNLEIAVSQELLVWLIWNEKVVSWYDSGSTVWPCPLNTPKTLTLGVSRSESEIALSQEWGGWLTWNKKDVSHQFKTVLLTSVAMVLGWADVPDSDRGDFRRRRAVDISSSYLLPLRIWHIIYDCRVRCASLVPIFTIGFIPI